MAKKHSAGKRIKVHKDLKGFAVRVNEFGEIRTSIGIDELNQFLNRNVDDKKLRDRIVLAEEEE